MSTNHPIKQVLGNWKVGKNCDLNLFCVAGVMKVICQLTWGPGSTFPSLNTMSQVAGATRSLGEGGLPPQKPKSLDYEHFESGLCTPA